MRFETRERKGNSEEKRQKRSAILGMVFAMLVVCGSWRAVMDMARRILMPIM